jgi:hypothetical protein
MMDSETATIDLTIIRQRLSPARIQRYEDAVGDGLTAAMDLYLWNIDLSAAFYAIVQGVEVVLRNALSEQMEELHRSRGYDGSWFDDPFGLLDARRRADIDEARVHLRRDGHPATQDRLITQMSFGFWRYLLATHNEHTLWVPALHKAFPHAPTRHRRYVSGRVERLHYLRNRIAHHEPLFKRRLSRDVEEAHEVVEAICPTSANWLQLCSWAPALWRHRAPTQSRRGD